MIEIREIIGVESLHEVYNDIPEALHIVLYDEDTVQSENCIYKNLEKLSESKLNGALVAVADMTKPENEPLKDERDFHLFPSVEYTKDNKSYFRSLGHMSENEFYKAIEDVESGYYIPMEE